MELADRTHLSEQMRYEHDVGHGYLCESTHSTVSPKRQLETLKSNSSSAFQNYVARTGQ